MDWARCLMSNEKKKMVFGNIQREKKMGSRQPRIALCSSHNRYETEFPISTCLITPKSIFRIAVDQLPYAHDLRKEPHIISSRVQDGDSVMVWVAFFFHSVIRYV